MAVARVANEGAPRRRLPAQSAAGAPATGGIPNAIGTMALATANCSRGLLCRDKIVRCGRACSLHQLAQGLGRGPNW
eukprot:11181885-Lingulodinium_polyedra.AAC.1